MDKAQDELRPLTTVQLLDAAIWREIGYALVVVHNHPSGDVSPSEADTRLTRRIAEAARILQIQLLDHVIVGQPLADRQGYFSFKEAGVIS